MIQTDVDLLLFIYTCMMLIQAQLRNILVKCVSLITSFSILELTQSEISSLFNAMDLERLRRYSRSLVDFHLVNDLLPRLAQIYFQRRLPNVRLNKTQQVNIVILLI